MAAWLTVMNRRVLRIRPGRQMRAKPGQGRGTNRVRGTVNNQQVRGSNKAG